MSRPRPSRLHQLSLVGALLAIVLGLNGWALDRYGSDLPKADQWDAEAVHAIGPWFSGDHFAQHLFAAHNEHRVVLTKAQNLALTLINGQWDARVQCVANAFLHAAIALGLWLLARRALAPPWHLPFLALITALFALPLSDENLLGGFHAQQYWLILLALPTITLLPSSQPGSRRWWVGVTTAVAGLGAMSSGHVAAMVVACVAVWRWLSGETTARWAWPTLLATGGIIAIGEFTRVEVAEHAVLRAASAHDFILTLLRALAWPLHGNDWAGPFLWAPWLWLTARTLAGSLPTKKGRSKVDAASWTTLALGAWAFAQILVTAFARGAGGAYPAPRYTDTLAFGLAINGLAALQLLQRTRANLASDPDASHPGGVLPQALRIAAVVGWAVLLATGVEWQVSTNLRGPLPAAKAEFVGNEEHLRAYVATGDVTELAEPIPFPPAPELVKRLSLPGILPLLPASVRPALALAPAGAEGFTRNWLTPRTPGPAAHAGLPPSLAPLTSRATWGSYPSPTLGEWRSRPMPPSSLGWLRFDVAGYLGQPGVSLELRDATTDTVLSTVSPAETTGNWRAAYVRTPSVPFVVVARDTDAQRWLAFSAPVEVGPLSYAAHWAVRHALWLVTFGVAVALLASIYLAHVSQNLAVFGGQEPIDPVSPSGLPPARRRLVLVVMVFFIVWFAKLAVIGQYATDLPLWDQWAKEGELVYAPWFERHEFWGPMFLPHSEHRIAPTLALNLGLLRLGDNQWDARVQCAVSAALHALIAAGLAAWALRRLRAGWAVAVVGTIVLVTAPPIAWENVLLGFQSQFYFLAGFSLLAVGGMLSGRAGSWRWFGGLAALGLGSVSMGSGMLAAFPIALVAVLRLFSRSKSAAGVRPYARGDAVATALAALAIGATAWWLRPAAPWHVPLHAHSFLQSAIYGLRCLSWPLYTAPWLAVLLWAPWTVLAVRRLGLRLGGATPLAGSVSSDLILAGGVWVLAQVAAVSYARSGGSALPAPRYGDVFAIGVVLNSFALAWQFASSSDPALRSRRVALLGVWSLLLAGATFVASRATFTTDLVQRREDSRACVRSVRSFLRTDDAAALVREPTLPFPYPDWLVRMLRNPTLRQLLPASVQLPVAVPGLSADARLSRAPGLAPLPDDGTRIVTAGETWRSGVLPAGKGWWKFETAGDVGRSGVTLELASATSGQRLASVVPTKIPDAHWRAAYVPIPQEPAVLVARVTSPARWVGFSAPYVVSPLSYRTWRLTQHAPLLTWLSLAALLTSAGWVLGWKPRASPLPATRLARK